MKFLKNQIVIVYANPIQRTGFSKEAELLKILKDYGKMAYCKVKMLNTNLVCNVFINEYKN